MRLSTTVTTAAATSAPSFAEITKTFVNLTAPSSPQVSQAFLESVQSVLPSSPGQSWSANATQQQQLAAAVEEAAVGLISGVFQAQSATVNVSQVVTLVAGGISMTVAVLPVSSNGEGAAAAPPSPGLPLAKSLPLSAVEAATQVSGRNASASSRIGLTSCRWTSLNPFGNATNVAANGARKVVAPSSDVVSLSVTDEKGKKVPLSDLAEPLMLVISLSKLKVSQDDFEKLMLENRVPECRFWNETESRWAGDGCKSMGLRDRGSGPELLCACTHLTTFAVFESPEKILTIAEDIGKFLYSTLIVCARVDALFSTEGMEALQSGHWVTRASAVVFFLPALVLFLKLVLTAVWDVQHRKDLPWIWAGMEHVAWPSCQSEVGEILNFVFKPWAWPLRITRFAMETVVAHDLRLQQVTLKIVEEAKYKRPGFEPTSRDLHGRDPEGSAVLVAKAAQQMIWYKHHVRDEFTFRHLPSIESVGKRRWACFLVRKCCALLFHVFRAVHPLMFPALVDLYTFSSQRVVALAIQFLGSLFGCALYYQQTTALTFHSPQECATTTFDERMRKAIPISIVSALLSTGTSQSLYNMISARPRPDQRIGQQKDRVVGILFYILGLCVCGFFLMYIAAFLANVSEESAQIWILSAAWTFTSTVLFVPFGQALGLVAWTTIFLYRYPALVDKIFVEGEESEKEDPETPKGVTATTKILVRSAADVPVSGQDMELPGQIAGDAIVPSAVPVSDPSTQRKGGASKAWEFANVLPHQA